MPCAMCCTTEVRFVQEELFVGTRSGHVRLFDVKQRGRRADAPAPQVGNFSCSIISGKSDTLLL